MLYQYWLIFRAYVNCTGPGFALHSDIVMPYISHIGTQEQIEKYLPDMTAGRKIGAIAMTEPGAGRLVNPDTVLVIMIIRHVHKTS